MSSERTQAALITGGSSGIGLAIAQMLGQEGYHLTIVGQTPNKVTTAQQQLQQAGHRVLGVVANISSEAAIHDAVEQRRTTYKRLDVLVKCAGVLGRGAIKDYPTTLLDQVLAINVRAPILFYRECLDLLCVVGAQGRALVINLSSISGKRGDAECGVYSASKFGLMGLTQSINAELRSSGIASCAVCPPVVNTEMGSWAVALMDTGQMLQPTDVARKVREILHLPAESVPGEIDFPMPT